jgi:predicted Zn-dependent protease
MLPVPGAAGSALRAAVEGAPLAQGALGDFEEPEEVELGRAITANIGARFRLARDRRVTTYVALVGNTVAAHSDRPDLRYAFAVLDAPEVNAFAAPGGYVFVTRGALAVMRDEATLAGVLGHEIAHVALRHGVDAIRAEKRKQLALFGVRQGVGHTPIGAFAGLVASAADVMAEQVVLKGFSRADEGAADRAGVEYARRAGYDPAGLRDFLAAMQARGEAEARFFSSHPGTRERLEEQDALLRTRPGAGRRHAERFASALALATGAR